MEYITKKSVSSWTRQVLLVLQEATTEEVEEEDTDMEHSDSEIGHSHLVWIGKRTDFTLLDPLKVQQAYNATQHRVFLLDYGGTIIARANMSMYVKKEFNAISGRAPSFSPNDDSIKDCGQILQHFFTCTIGKKPSNAHLYVNEVGNVGETLV